MEAYGESSPAYTIKTDDRERRRRLVLLTRILLKYLECTDNITLLHRVKSVVRTCTKHHRLGDASFSPLHDVIERRLKMLVDGHIWDRVLMCLDLYMNREENIMPTAMPLSISSELPGTVTRHFFPVSKVAI